MSDVSASPRRRPGAPLVVLATLGAVLVVGTIAWKCPVLLVAGVPCPTCGVTRAFLLALHGDVAGAMRMHPLMWLAVPVTLLFFGAELLGYARTRAWGSSRRIPYSNVLMLGTAVLLFALWIARFAGYFGGPV
ncbi:MAG: hypothetical protein JWO86_4219 [Myxococcaceae bacterium]|nr:hypothetical protein [Myxococcaceae bacterium]